MSLTLPGKYTVLDQELGKGAWSVVRPCEPIPPYKPPNTEAQPLFGGAGHAGPHDPAAAAPMQLVAKVISKAHVQSLAGGNATRAREDVMREVDTLRVLPPHPNVVRFIEHLEDDENYYIIFEAAPKGDLCDLILKAPESRIPEEQARQFTVETIRAVLHCHRHGTAHRDIKPENLLVGEGDVLKLTDFGLAKVLRPAPPAANGSTPSTNDGDMPSPTSQAERRQFDFLATAPDPTAAAMFPAKLWADGPKTAKPTAAGAAPTGPSAPYCPGHEIVGTLRYGAPEMFRAKFERGTFDAFQADAWSVGVVVYIMLTGNFPFSAGGDANERATYKALLETAVAPPAYLSSAASDFLSRLLNKNPDKRMTLAEALDHRWLRETVDRNDSAARNAFRLRHTEPRDEGRDRFPTAPPPVVLPPAVMRLRGVIDDVADKLASADSEQLRAAFDDVLGSFDLQASAMARLREQLLAAQAAKAAATATTGSSSGRVGSTSAAARRGVVSPAPGSTRGSSGSRPRETSSGRTATPTSAVRRPPSPAAARRPLASPAAPQRGASPATRAGATTPTTRTGATTPTGRPGTLTPTRRTSASPVAKPATSASTIGARRTNSPTVAGRTGASVTPTGSGTTRTASGSRAPATTSSGRSAVPASATGPAARRASPLARASPVARRGTPLRPGTTPVASAANGTRRPPPPPPTGAAGASLAVGDTATYKGAKAIVRFVGETSFASGQWVGLEMVEGADGIHDGTSAVDKRRYFTCPTGRGIFVRPSQVHTGTA